MSAFNASMNLNIRNKRRVWLCISCLVSIGSLDSCASAAKKREREWQDEDVDTEKSKMDSVGVSYGAI